MGNWRASYTSYHQFCAARPIPEFQPPDGQHPPSPMPTITNRAQQFGKGQVGVAQRRRWSQPLRFQNSVTLGHTRVRGTSV